jgi:tetratricopeptide (TPR) repeat protein
LSTEDRAACFANRAAAKLKLEDYEGCLFAYDRLKISTEAFIGALEDCSEALSLDENYWKAKYRRKECYLKLGRYEEALKDAKALV